MDFMTTEGKLNMLRLHMKRCDIDALIIPQSDPHNSEYISPCFRRREFISSFSGSAGTALVTLAQFSPVDAVTFTGDALLWTDGRYFIQAEQELSSQWKLMKSGTQGTLTIGKWIAKNLKPNSKLAIDPSLHTYNDIKRLMSEINAETDFQNKGLIQIISLDQNLVDLVWGDARPPSPQSLIRIHSASLAGVTVRDKLKNLASLMDKKNTQMLLCSMLDEIAWVLNIRGADVPYCPVVVAYLVIFRNEETFSPDLNKELESGFPVYGKLYVYPGKIPQEVENYLLDANVKIEHYDNIYQDLEASRNQGKVVWMHPENTSLKLYTAASGNDDTDLFKNAQNVLLKDTPIPMLKAVKNCSELEGLREAHIKDGMALSNFFAWAEDQISSQEKKCTINEFEISEKVDGFRAQQKGFLGPSFETIAASGPNGAIIHYRPRAENSREVDAKNLFLLDSGGQYLEGTTDITRTVHFGDPTLREKEMFTRVLKGNIALEKLIFPEGTTGYAIDAFARKFLWEIGLEYRHGTGHGVGSALNVHEGPHGISQREGNKVELKRGMLTSNEPGYYETDHFGIRIENVLVIVEAKTRENFDEKTFLTFENLTMCPLQSKMILMELLNEDEKKFIDNYHDRVWRTLSSRMDDGPGKFWLRSATKPMFGSCTDYRLPSEAVASSF